MPRRSVAGLIGVSWFLLSGCAEPVALESRIATEVANDAAVHAATDGTDDRVLDAVWEWMTSRDDERAAILEKRFGERDAASSEAS